MGTRGMVGLVSDGTVYGSYVHFDSYPSALGEKVADFVTHVRTAGVETIKTQVTRLSLVDEETKPTAEQRKRYEHLTDDSVSEGDDWYAILRHAQGDLQAYLDAEIWIDGLGFAGDSLMCEWAYLVNVDDETVEFYKGFNKGITRGRFAGLANRDPTATARSRCWPRFRSTSRPRPTSGPAWRRSSTRPRARTGTPPTRSPGTSRRWSASWPRPSLRPSPRRRRP
jgi:hypothetical protein